MWWVAAGCYGLVLLMAVITWLQKRRGWWS